MMVRKGLAALLVPLATAAWVNAAPAAPVLIAQQEGAVVDAPAPPVPLPLGERVADGVFEITVLDAISAASPTAAGFTEVRAAVTVRNISSVPFLYSDVAFFSGDLYPRLQVRDAAGDVHRADVVRPERGTLPGSDLHLVEPGLAARWIVGFQVPTRSAGALVLEAVRGGVPYAAWDLAGTGAVRAWEAPQDTLVRLGEAVQWTADLTVTPLEVGTLVCGDPDVELVAEVVAVTMRVQNGANGYTEWPGVRAPLIPAVAQWGDGTSAAFSMETRSGDDEDTLWRHSAEWGYLPPGATAQRAFVFAAPRDARLGRVSDPPAGVLLMTPLGERLWLDLSDVEASVGLSPAFCDLGFFGAPLPYAYSPSVPFEIGGAPARPDAEAQDLAALQLLTTARAAAGLYYDVHRDFDDASSADLEAFGPIVDFAARAADDPPAAAEGTVYWDALDDGSLYLITESESGRWFCVTQTPGLAPAVSAEGPDPDGVAGQCITVEDGDTGDTGDTEDTEDTGA
jgi:hypothetical protein